MLVEEFTTEELTDKLEIDSADAVRGLVEQLGLEGQQKFFEKSNLSTGVFPYRKMTEQENIVYGTLCPSHTDLEDYGDGVIPIHVLQIASHAKGLGFFKKLEV